MAPRCDELVSPPAVFWILLTLCVGVLGFAAREARALAVANLPTFFTYVLRKKGDDETLWKQLLALIICDRRRAHAGPQVFSEDQVSQLSAAATQSVHQALAFALMTVVVMGTDSAARVLYGLVVCGGPPFRLEGLLIAVYYFFSALLFYVRSGEASSGKPAGRTCPSSVQATKLRIIADSGWVGATAAYATYALTTAAWYVYSGPAGACALGEAAWGVWLSYMPIPFALFGAVTAFLPLLLLRVFRKAGRDDVSWATLLVSQTAAVLLFMAVGQVISLRVLHAAQAHGMCGGFDAAACNAAGVTGALADACAAVAAGPFSSSAAFASPRTRALKRVPLTFVLAVLPHALLLAACVWLATRCVSAWSLLTRVAADLAGAHNLMPPTPGYVQDEWLELRRTAQAPLHWRALERHGRALLEARGLAAETLRLVRGAATRAFSIVEVAARRAFFVTPATPAAPSGDESTGGNGVGDGVGTELALAAPPPAAAAVDDFDILPFFNSLMNALVAGSGTIAALSGALSTQSVASTGYCTRRKQARQRGRGSPARRSTTPSPPRVHRAPPRSSAWTSPAWSSESSRWGTAAAGAASSASAAAGAAAPSPLSPSTRPRSCAARPGRRTGSPRGSTRGL